MSVRTDTNALADLHGWTITVDKTTETSYKLEDLGIIVWVRWDRNTGTKVSAAEMFRNDESVKRFNSKANYRTERVEQWLTYPRHYGMLDIMEMAVERGNGWTSTDLTLGADETAYHGNSTKKDYSGPGEVSYLIHPSGWIVTPSTVGVRLVEDRNHPPRRSN